MTPTNNAPTKVEVIRPEPDQGGELIPVPVQEAQAIMAALEQRPKRWATWDQKTPEGVALSMSCEFGNHQSVSQHLNRPVQVKGVFVKPGASKDKQTGEIKTYPYTVFVLADGTTLATTSSRIADAVPWLCNYMGDPPWAGTVPLIFRAGKVPGGGTCMWLEIDTGDKPAGGPQEARNAPR